MAQSSSGNIFKINETKKLRLEHKLFRKHQKFKFRRLKTSGPFTKISFGKEKLSGPPVCILDNGGYFAKVGFSTDKEAKLIPNCIMKVKSERKRFFIGNQIEDCRDLSSLYYLLPCEKGYITKWNVQKPVWDYIFNNVCPIEGNPVVITQPLFNFKPIQEIMDELFFEEYEIKSMCRTTCADLAKYEYTKKVIGSEAPCIIVDSGFSFTHIIPYINGNKYYKAVRRIDVGGKLLTNHLKDIISYRQLHVMDETYVINQVKEDACFVSVDFKNDMKIAGSHSSKNTIVRNYVLPDFNIIRRGYIQEPGVNVPEVAEGCQILKLNNERFTVPEILFLPSNISMECMGISEAIIKCIKLCPTKCQPLLAKHIILIGGNAKFPGYKERIQSDVQSFLPDFWKVSVYLPEDPITYPWSGGKTLSTDSSFKSLLVTKEQYEENGPSYTYKKYSDWINVDKDSYIEPLTNVTEYKPSENSILLSGNFSRFDLFGKYEQELQEAHTNFESDSNVKTESSDRLNVDVDTSNGVHLNVEDHTESTSNTNSLASTDDGFSKKSCSEQAIWNHHDVTDSYDFDNILNQNSFI